jgi:hypothetical protein
MFVWFGFMAQWGLAETGKIILAISATHGVTTTSSAGESPVIRTNLFAYYDHADEIPMP